MLTYLLLEMMSLFASAIESSWCIW